MFAKVAGLIIDAQAVKPKWFLIFAVYPFGLRLGSW